MSKHRFRIPSTLPESKEDLLSLKIRTEDEIASIKLQLSEAREDASQGNPTDKVWLAKASRALIHYGRISQHIQSKLGQIKSAEKQSNIAGSLTTEKHFVDVARERLIGELFVEIMEEAKYRAGANS